MVFYHNREQTALRQKQVFIDEDNIKDSTYQTSANGSFTVAGLEAGIYIVEELAMMQNRPGSEYAAAARDEAIRMRDDITQYLPEIRL